MTNTKHIKLDELITLLNNNTELLTTGYDNAVDVLITKINEIATSTAELEKTHKYKFRIGDIVEVTEICPGMPYLKPIVEKGEVVELPSETGFSWTGKNWYRVKTRDNCFTYTEDSIELIRRNPS